MFGYAGKILYVDLSEGKIEKHTLSENFAKTYIGGTGFCARILYDETGPETRPLGPENRLIFAVGPFTGTIWPTSGRLNIAAKSPLTEIWGESNAGGHFAPALKYAGYDAIVIYGASEKPAYLWIDDEDVRIMDASYLWGKDIWETDDMIKKDLGDEDIQVAAIGQAGENLVLFANVINELFRANGRTGLGAVMGSKNLKAIAVRGSNGVKVADPEKFKKLISDVKQRIQADPFSAVFSKYGTECLTALMSEIGRFPTKNHQTGVFPFVDKIDGEAILKYKVRDKACFSCVLACKNFLAIRSGQYAGMCGDHPEYETIDSFGGRVWNDDAETILHANWLCDQYGMDTISAGGAIAFAMELWEKGILKKEDTGGLDFSWGNKETIIEMIHKIAKREGFGDVLADGVARAAKRIGKGTEKYAMHVKGLEISAQDGRAQKSMAIAHATSVRGADHLRHCTFYDEIGLPEPIRERFGEQYLPEMADRLSPKYKGIMAKELEDFTALVDSLLLCIYTMLNSWWDNLTEVYNAVTGFNMTTEDIKRACERIVNLKRAYNIRLGLTRKDDTLPDRFLKEPAPDGPCKGQVVELDYMLNEYYEQRGLDKVTGFIPKSKLLELGLDDVARELESMGRVA